MWRCTRRPDWWAYIWQTCEYSPPYCLETTLKLNLSYKAAFAATGDRLYLEEELRVRTYCLGDDHPLVKALVERLTGV